MKKPQEGLDRINEALKKVGMQAHLLDTRGVILLRLDKITEAIKDLELAVTGLPTAPVFYHLARAYQKAGKTADFEKYRDLARKANLKPEQLQASEREEASKLVGFAKAAEPTAPKISKP
jgi:predicted Zn-dependent protease